MINKLKNLIRFGRVSQAGPDTGAVPSQQYDYHGKVGNGVPIYPYGYHAVADEDSYALVLIINGNNEERVTIPTSMMKRMTGAPGEVFVYHPNTGTMIKLDNAGNVVVDAKGEVDVTSPTLVRMVAPLVEIDGNLEVVGNVEVTGTTLLDGAVTAAAALSVVGATTLGTTVTSNGKNISDDHTHHYLYPGGESDTAGVN